MSYQGWKNYGTWALSLHLSNDESLYDTTNEIIRRNKDDYDAVEELESFVEDALMPDYSTLSLFAQDILQGAFDEIDFWEIVKDWREGMDEEGEEEEEEEED